MADQTGRVTVTVDTVGALRSKPGASCDMGGLVSEGGMTDQGLFYAKESYQFCTIECVLVHMSDTDLHALKKAKNVTVKYETDTGVTYTTALGRVANSLKLENGEVPVTIIGPPAK